MPVRAYGRQCTQNPKVAGSNWAPTTTELIGGERRRCVVLVFPGRDGGCAGSPFRMVELNVVGWSALLAPPALAGGVASLVGGAWDRWRWWNSVASVPGDPWCRSVPAAWEHDRGDVWIET